MGRLFQTDGPETPNARSPKRLLVRWSTRVSYIVYQTTDFKWFLVLSHAAQLIIIIIIIIVVVIMYSNKPTETNRVTNLPDKSQTLSASFWIQYAVVHMWNHSLWGRDFVGNTTHAMLRHFFQVHLGESMLSQRETYWNNLWIFMSRMSFLPLNL